MWQVTWTKLINHCLICFFFVIGQSMGMSCIVMSICLYNILMDFPLSSGILRSPWLICFLSKLASFSLPTFFLNFSQDMKFTAFPFYCMISLERNWFILKCRLNCFIETCQRAVIIARQNRCSNGVFICILKSRNKIVEEECYLSKICVIGRAC